MISSTANPRIKNIIRLKKSARARNEQDVFLVEGPRMFFEAPKDRIRETYLTEAFLDRYRDELKDYPYELISDQVCRHISDTRTPQGVTALLDRDPLTLEELLALEDNPLFLLLENLQDPGNLGTILRTAEGAGVTGIIMNRETADPYQPKVIRATMGTIFREPFVVVDDLRETVGLLRERGIAIYAAHLSGSTFYREDYRKGCGFLIGNEGKGLSEELSACADRLIRIPMKGKVESLNAAVAATVLVYEVQRQRRWE